VPFGGARYKASMRERILHEIDRLAKGGDGRPPGKAVFERETGITESAWRGVYWARWGDALIEAGYEPNKLNAPIDAELLLEKLALAVRRFQKLPTVAELRMYCRADPGFPAHSTLDNRFKSRAQMWLCVRDWVLRHDGYEDIRALFNSLEDSSAAKSERSAQKEGFVYLIRSGGHFKIGRSDELERRIKEIRTAMPDTATLEHSIRTDDPPGIEAYWHRRFADRRANGEWFKLTPQDVAAFKRRKYQ